MSSKINPWHVCRYHLSTLHKPDSDAIAKTDVATFFVVPVALACAGVFYDVNIGQNAVSILVTAGAVFVGLLLNLMILIYDQQQKIPKETVEAPWTVDTRRRFKLLNELFYNIGYCVLIALALICICIFVAIIGGSVDSVMQTGKEVTNSGGSRGFLVNNVAEPAIIFCATNLILTMLMVVKRTFILVGSE